jgi:hypothetical protein
VVEIPEVKQCIILGNGPSLLTFPGYMLDSMPTYGGNYIGRIYQPTYYICIDRFVILEPEIVETARNAKIAYLRDYDYGDIRPYELYNLPNIEQVSRDDYVWPGENHHSGCTLVYMALKIAFSHFDIVYLVGVDHTSGHFYQGGRDRHTDIMAVREEHYRIARREYDRAGKRIINLSPPSALDSIFER